MSAKVFIGISLDGYIADRDGGLNFLTDPPNPNNLDYGFVEFMLKIDGLVIGRKTFEAIRKSSPRWPFSKPTFVLSKTLKAAPEELKGKVEVFAGTPHEIVRAMKMKKSNRLYIDGGLVIRSFLDEDLIDEMTIIQMPVLLGGGTKLFGTLTSHMEFEHINTEIFQNGLIKTRYKRKH
ncbi:dihydrofolate reductase family protein [Parendozoicomonas sp. Alg238-R29]|uniref:dihydrofolate reductase family protein n=1 Tax=Parendozoicomonas sp. Alg238-R29 TaxID=2993446 RepID=UPI00248E7283|nr:dihydrofolate reductase family protein [Parendozoicomonas sp. Alg238-R29]